MAVPYVTEQNVIRIVTEKLKEQGSVAPSKDEIISIVNDAIESGEIKTEPIISINMTNMDVTGIDNAERVIRDLQFYCTKERWDNFVALSKQQFQVDVTYDNFGSLFMDLSVEQQSTALGYLLMDYYNGKILPEAYLQQGGDMPAGYAKIKYGISNMTTLTYQQMQIEVVIECQFSGENTQMNGTIPALEMFTTNYYTADTVATVKEINGPVIGAGSSESSEGTKLYEHNVQVGTLETETSGFTIKIITNFKTPFANALELFNTVADSLFVTNKLGNGLCAFNTSYGDFENLFKVVSMYIDNNKEPTDIRLYGISGYTSSQAITKSHNLLLNAQDTLTDTVTELK